MTFDAASHRRAAEGSDNWPVTWSDDDHQYAVWGDGGGFNGTESDGRASFGVARIEGAHLALLDLEELDDKDLDRICSDYRELAQQARKDLRAGKSDTDVREVGGSHRKEANAKRRRKATK